MDKLAFGDGADLGDTSSGTPSKPPHRTRGKPSPKSKGPTIVSATVPAAVSAVADMVVVLAARQGSKLFIQVEGLSWLANFVRDEYSTGGVAPIPDDDGVDSPLDESGGISWCFRDHCWITRLKNEEGGLTKMYNGVHARMKPGKDLAHLAFEDAKEMVYQELVAMRQSDGL